MRDFDRFKDNAIIDRDITIKGEYEGFHKYEDAPDEVAFLRHLHRHIFKWRAVIGVTHDNRELEFFMVKRVIETEILPFQGTLGSCEMQAEFILQGLVNKYGPDRFYLVSVSEDGENEGTISWTHPF